MATMRREMVTPFHDLSTMETGKPVASAPYLVGKRMDGESYGKKVGRFEAEIWPALAPSVADGSHGARLSAKTSVFSMACTAGQLACNGWGEQPF